MSYRVEYETLSGKYEVRQGSSLRLTILTAAFGVVLLAGVWNLWPDGRAVLERLVRQLNWADTRAALEAMALQLRQGIPAGEAVTAFCRELAEKGLAYGT